MLANRTIDVNKDCLRPSEQGGLSIPQSFEALSDFYNFVLYSITVPVEGRLLVVEKLQDFAYM